MSDLCWYDLHLLISPCQFHVQTWAMLQKLQFYWMKWKDTCCVHKGRSDVTSVKDLMCVNINIIWITKPTHLPSLLARCIVKASFSQLQCLLQSSFLWTKLNTLRSPIQHPDTLTPLLPLFLITMYLSLFVPSSVTVNLNISKGRERGRNVGWKKKDTTHIVKWTQYQKNMLQFNPYNILSL